MDPVQTLVTPILMVFLAIIGGYLLKDRLDRIEDRVNDAPSREEFNALRAEVGMLRSEIVAMRSDLTQIALALGTRPQPQTG